MFVTIFDVIFLVESLEYSVKSYQVTVTVGPPLFSSVLMSTLSTSLGLPENLKEN